MNFNSEKPIYIQIADSICERILSGELKSGERIPSVREYGGALEVNPNTVMRTYERLTADGIIHNRRGIGYFIADDAASKVLEAERKSFYETELPLLKRRMELLGIEWEAVENFLKEGPRE